LWFASSHLEMVGLERKKEVAVLHTFSTYVYISRSNFETHESIAMHGHGPQLTALFGARVKTIKEISNREKFV